MSSLIKRSAISFSLLGAKDRNWLLSKLDYEQRERLLDAQQRYKSLIERLGPVCFDDLHSVLNRLDQGEFEKKCAVSFFDVPYLTQIQVAESLSLESIYVLAHCESWRNKEIVLANISSKKQEEYRLFCKKVKFVPTPFHIESVLEYLSVRYTNE
ncbi:hypothetical protein [Ketobacter alkanivorans]|uniref:Uncharacterized protein n=1 Tax=Ketobacter alkanivorans TaxID=1917421 RepID=A0A2K9LLA6_9GAMM|nr:hypothetical protein [Ketobacter alkanivorans]AUM12961.1 hypothetical protein Kalk_11225 [Ketobacter alkanivorans]